MIGDGIYITEECRLGDCDLCEDPFFCDCNCHNSTLPEEEEATAYGQLENRGATY